MHFDRFTASEHLEKYFRFLLNNFIIWMDLDKIHIHYA